MGDKTELEDADGFDPDKREMCSDGMCIGVIGHDGRCKVCGKPGISRTHSAPRDTSSAWRPSAPPANQDEDEDEDEDREDLNEEGDEDEISRDGERSAQAAAGAGKKDFVYERVPCPDGLCTGIIGRNGRCGTCGKPHDWREPRR